MGARGLGERGWIVAEARVGVAHFPEEDLTDLRTVAVDRRHQNVGGPVMAELHDELGEVSLVRLDPRPR